mmetsp:Transcript_13156/g.48815  ORF Transcript_13156/g.48815 Transcript_13156/m.48815 type:complete len:218 (-) Transcript_13156:309-962(-)
MRRPEAHGHEEGLLRRPVPRGLLIAVQLILPRLAQELDRLRGNAVVEEELLRQVVIVWQRRVTLAVLGAAGQVARARTSTKMRKHGVRLLLRVASPLLAVALRIVLPIARAERVGPGFPMEHLADAKCLVAVAPEELGHGRRVHAQEMLRATLEEVDAGRVGPPAGQQSVPTGVAAGRIAVGSVEAERSPCEGIDRRRHNLRVSIAAQLRPQIVGQN